MFFRNPVALLALALAAIAPIARADLGQPDLTVMQSLQTAYGWGPVFGWAANTNPCPTNGGSSWNGVSCLRGYVVSIIADCGAQQLNASLPPILGQLGHLQELEVRNCGLTGSIPDLSGAVDLSSLRLDNNALTGAIPSSLAALTAISTLNLANNLLTGEIPAFANSSFITINLAGNFLTGIPATWTSFNRNISYNAYPSLPASCDNQTTSPPVNICTPNRLDAPGTVTIVRVSGDGQRAPVDTVFPVYPYSAARKFAP